MKEPVETSSVRLTRRLGNFSEQLYEHYLNQHLTDVTFYFPNEEPVKAHKIVLAAYSSFLESQCDTEQRQIEILLIGFSREAFKLLLELMYKGKTLIENELKPEFNRIVRYFRIDENIFVENSGTVFSDAQETNSENDCLDETDVINISINDSTNLDITVLIDSQDYETANSSITKNVSPKNLEITNGSEIEEREYAVNKLNPFVGRTKGKILETANQPENQNPMTSPLKARREKKN